MRSVIKSMKRPTPVGLPVVVTQVAGYPAVAGTVASAVSQTAVKYERK